MGLDKKPLSCYNVSTERKGNDTMITYEMIADAQETLVKFWGDDGKKVIETCAKVTPFNGGCKKFLDHCTACGGNWGGMLLTGVHELWPEVWDAIPNDMGCFAWTCICSVLVLCGVDTSEK